MKKIIVANWKMNLSYQASVKLAKSYALSVKLKQTDKEVIVCPDYLSLPVISGIIKGTKLSLGAQDCSVALSGAWTGEVSAQNLKSLGVKYVIIGHSERRQGLGEDDNLISAKIKAATEAGLKVILCIGETAQIKTKGQTRRYLGQELRRDLSDLKDSSKLVIAYEPIWAISTASGAKAMDAREVDKIHRYIGSVVEKIVGRPVPVLYGGSVNPINAQSFLGQTHVSGLLVGSASLRLTDFEAID